MSGRIAFFSPREFGKAGTPGTYKVIEEVAKYHAVRVYSLPPSETTVHWWHEVPLVPLKGALTQKGLAPVVGSIEGFAPDILYIFNASHWGEAGEYLKGICPRAKIILDIKSPLLVDNSAQTGVIQNRSKSALSVVDRVITHAVASPKTWFGHELCDPVLLPPGIDLSLFPNEREPAKQRRGDRDRPLHLVYAATLNGRRQNMKLLEGFQNFLSQNKESAVLHIFGEGPQRNDLERQSEEKGFSEWVQFHGQVSQAELFSAMSRMDAAIGWVPKEDFDHSPSLKVLEYMAAQLPVLVTATSAHLEMEKEGFTLNFCEDTPESLAEGISRLVNEGFGEDRVYQNRRIVESRDYRKLVQEKLLPVLDELLDKSKILGAIHLKETAVADGRPGDRYASEMPLRILLLMSTTGTEVGMEERDAVEVAQAMAARGHRVYLAYQNQKTLVSKVDERVVVFPYEDHDALENLVQGGRLDVMVSFPFDNQASRPVAKLAAKYCLPLVVHDVAVPKIPRSERCERGERGRARTRWNEELFLSLVMAHTGAMLDLTYEQQWDKWESLLKQAAVNSRGQLGSEATETVLGYERMLHARRMRSSGFGS